MVHVDHLARPVRMSDAAKGLVWNAVWTPWGQPHSITGSGLINARFPGQWFQLEAGLHYNWHRHYDPSIGRYTQPDPLGFVDGPSGYGYAGGRPNMAVDLDGRAINIPIQLLGVYCRANPSGCAALAGTTGEVIKQIIEACMVAPGNVADTGVRQAWERDGAPKDRCKWLKENAARFRPDQVKTTQKAWGCRHSRQS
jgi:RHS repeat-associated protein